MNSKNSIIIIIICLITISITAQINSDNKNQLSILLYRNETVIEPINGNKDIDKFFNGIYYQRSFNNGLGGIAGLEYNQSGVYDNCIYCADNFYGTGNLKELSFLLGSKYLIMHGNTFFIHPYVQLDLFYSSSTYSGNFEGGFANQGYSFEDKYTKYGIIGRAGLELSPIRNLFLNISCNYRTGHFSGKRLREDISFSGTYSNWIPVELKLGVGF